MKRFENILYVSEPGAEETAAIERAVALARNNQARLTIMHASGEPRLGPLSETSSWPDRWRCRILPSCILDHIDCSVLAVKPDGFVSPVASDE